MSMKNAMPNLRQGMSSLVQEVIVKAKDDIRFIFKNGFEVRV